MSLPLYSKSTAMRVVLIFTIFPFFTQCLLVVEVKVEHLKPTSIAFSSDVSFKNPHFLLPQISWILVVFVLIAKWILT